MLKGLLRVGDWLEKVDLKDAYFMIPINELDRRFHSLCDNKVYQSNYLLFGLSRTPWDFTNTLN